MPTIPLPLSPLFPNYGGGALKPAPHGNILDRLILQDGAQGGKDEFNMDTLSVPFKIFAGSDWKKLLPARGTAISGFTDMVVWDPLTTYTVGKAWVELRMLLRGLLARNGVNNKYDGFQLNPKPKDATGIATAQIQGSDGSSTMDITFYRPQTVYRYVTTTDIVDAPQVINNPDQRRPYLINYAVRGSSAPPEQDDSGDDSGGDGSGGSGGAATFTGFDVRLRQRCIEVNTEQVGKFFTNEATVVYEYYDGLSAS